MDYELEHVTGIGKATAERLKSMGIDSIEKLATINLDVFLKYKVKGVGKATAIKYIENAKILLEELKGNKKKEIIKEIIKKDKLIFLSYATKDAELFKIREISENLTLYDEIENVLYWQNDMHDNIIKYMNDNLGKCDLMILFCSPNALNSEPVEKEWTAAESLSKPIIPVFIKKEHIPPLLSSRLGLEFDQSNIQKMIQELYKLISKKLKF
ncbi:MAG: TIR domain-containing protein [Promethearchaeota archaeon]